MDPQHWAFCFFRSATIQLLEGFVVSDFSMSYFTVLQIESQSDFAKVLALVSTFDRTLQLFNPGFDLANVFVNDRIRCGQC